MKRYKFLRTGLKSDSGSLTWKIGKWEKTKGELNICHNGLHCSKYPDQAFGYVQGEILAIVETKGKSIKEDSKECWEEMKIVKAYNWKKEDSVAMAIYCAELVIGNFEKEYPNDDRPRKAIEAAKAWIKNPSESAALSAESAALSVLSAARSARSAALSTESAALSVLSAAWSARSAAESAARSARSAALSARSALSAESAAWSARSAAESAALSAESAARSARSALSARSAAKKEIVKKIRTWMTRRITKLEEIK